MTVPTRFHDRTAAGEELAAVLAAYHFTRPLVVGLPRGGVPVAGAVARKLGLELDVLVIRKLATPDFPEVAFGALGPAGVTVLNDWMLSDVPLPEQAMQEVVARETAELDRREAAYREGRPPLAAEGRDVIIVDDGLATGATMRAAIEVLHRLGAARCIVAVPVAASDAFETVGGEADEMVAILTPGDFVAVGRYYDDFSQTTDREVRSVLQPFFQNGNGRIEAAGAIGDVGMKPEVA